MALKILSYLFLAHLLLTPALAQVTKTKAYREAYRSYEARDYRQSLSTLNTRFNLRGNKLPASVAILAGYNYEALKDFYSARQMYQMAIDQAFYDDNKRIMESYQAQGNAFDIGEVPPFLSKLYGRLARIYLEDYNSRVIKLSDGAKEYSEKMIRTLSDICLEVECDDTDPDEILDALDKVKQNFSRSQFAWTKNLSISLITWKDSLNLTNASTSQEIESTTKGSCIGGELGYGNYYYQYAGSFCFASTKASVGKDSEQISYFQNEVAVNALIFAPTFYWMPYGGSAALGFEVPMVYRSGDYTEPDGFEIEGNQSFNLGFGLSLNWKTPSWSLFSKLNKVSGFKSNFFQLGMRYHF